MGTRGRILVVLLLGAALSCTARGPEEPPPSPAASAPAGRSILGGSAAPSAPPAPGPVGQGYQAALRAHPDPDAQAAAERLGAGEPGEARDLLEQALSRSPEDPVLLVAMAYAESDLGYYSLARRRLDLAEKGEVSEQALRDIRFLRMTALAGSNRKEALQLLEEQVAASPTPDPGLLLLLSEALLTRDMVEKLPPEEEKALHERAEALARQVLEKPLPGLSGEAHGTLGCSLWAQDDRKGAIQQFQAAIKDGLGSRDRALDIHGALGWLLYVEGDPEAAAEQFDQVVALTDSWDESTYYRTLPKRENALIFRDVLAGKPYTPEEMAAGLPRLQELKEAGLDPASEARSVHLKRMANVARLRKEGKPAEALGEMIEMLPVEEKPPGRPSVRCFFLYKYDWPLGRSATLTLAGNLAREAGDAPMARNLYRRALEVMPDNRAAREGLEALPKG